MSRTLFFLLFLLISASVFGQRYFIFNRLSRAEGLNTNSVNCVWQDQKGFLWVGTENGIQRFDGRKFIRFRTDGNEFSMPPFGVDQILDAGNGRMWIRQGRMIGQFDPVSFHYYTVPVETERAYPPQSNLQLYTDSKGNTFLCIAKYGLLWYDPAQSKFTEDNLPISVPEDWPVSSLFEDTQTGNYWISSERGLALYESATQSLIYHGHNPSKHPFFETFSHTFVNNFYIDKNNTWWIFYWDFDPRGEKAEVLHYCPEKNESLNDTLGFHAAFPGYAELAWIYETRLGQVWMGGINALLKHNSETGTLIQYRKTAPKEYEIKCREIKQMFEDREGNSWLSTDNGLYILTPEKSVMNYVFETQSKDKDIMVTSILETRSKDNWLGTWGNGILTFDDQFKPVKHEMYSSLPRDKLPNYYLVWDLCQHSLSGHVWSVCQGGAIAVFDPGKKSTVAFVWPPVFKYSTIRKVVEDKDGNLLFGTQSGQLIRWRYGTEISDENFEIVRDFKTAVFALYRDREDRIWVGTHSDGVFAMDPSVTDVLHHFIEKPFHETQNTGNSVQDIVQLNDSIFFVSSGFLDIININSGEVKVLTQYQGLPGGNVSQMLIDDKDVLWFTSNNGLVSYNYENNIFVSYNERNGIIMADKSTNAKFRMQNGEFWFGGENVLFGFRPEGLKFKTAPPDVTLTDFKLFDTFIPLDSLLSSEKVVFQPHENSFTIYFSSLSFTQQDQLVYYYKMEGVDKDWNRAENNLTASYTTLAPGDYVFHVKCINMQGLESLNTTTLRMTILPHFYQTRWFIALFFLLIAGLTYLFYRMRLNKLLAVERIRIKVARDLHDDVGSTLSTINILSSMAKTKLLTDPVKTSEYISKITDNSQQMMEAMDDIVWSIKPDNDNMQKIVARMREYASSILEPRNVDVSFHVEEKIYDLRLNMETRRDVFLIFKEAVNNSAKYSRCTKVDIFITHEHKELKIRIADNGIGFNSQTADSGNGLGNMQKRAEALRGEIKIESEKGKGTRILLLIPVTG
ncbi:hypothetical protein INQ51_20965 [Maribellus sp. CM-23]|uniref:ligand-binding sensor domain-containing protein n=1 Tax=Maribellus sp. CM-23 TaxID=2781026 RepID=UPI001F3C9F0F|nr:sensor histidine kinase [Maribellus sp. CM-23]MCE4566806.1 hypothetical protein [Maribellus sp. CM-23]